MIKKRKKKGVCRYCGVKIIPAWVSCNDCSAPKRKEMTTRRNILWEKEYRSISLQQIAEQQETTIENYQQFFFFFREELKPLQARWRKLHGEIDKDIKRLQDFYTVDKDVN